ncbi:MAG: hypothetical protein MUC76_03195 [Spirochaetes bacterium]|jgi:hypothetical protein|nr:hypothetical protein [Spirochaetota bacterium]
MEDPKDLLHRVHHRVLDEMQGGGDARSRDAAGKIGEADRNLRKAIAALYLALEEIDSPAVAVEILSEHAAMLVDMIRQIKGGR